MKKLTKVLAPFAVGILVGLFAFANILTVSATPPAPTPGGPTQCTACQTTQDDLNNAYAELDVLVTSTSVYGSQIEALLEQTTSDVFAGDSASMTVELDNEVTNEHLLSGSSCEDSSNAFAYYSSFSYNGTIYCVENEDMWFGTSPNFSSFFGHMVEMANEVNATLADEWQTVQDAMIELLTDHDNDGTSGILEESYLIGEFIDALMNCEDQNCPAEVECPNCQAIADQLKQAFTDLDALEEQSNILEITIINLENQINAARDQLEELETLQNEFRQMVLNAGGKVDANCDGFEPESGQSWGIAHTFGDVQWCFTNEGQLEDMIKNLDDYWKNHSSLHLPSEQTLKDRLNKAMDDHIAALDSQAAILDLINSEYTTINELLLKLKNCIDTLKALQANGDCLNEDITALQKALDDGNSFINNPYKPIIDPEDLKQLDDIENHWAEDFIKDLFQGGVVSGDEGTNNFRPNDNINRAEAAKIVTKANKDEIPPCDSFFDVFPDIKSDDWFCPFVDTAQKNGYFSGYEDGTFGPGNPILRAEAAAVVLRTLGFDIPEYDSYSFPDITGDEWYANYAEKAYKCGIFQGRTVGDEQHFAGGETITRAEFAKIVDIAIYNLLTEDQCN